MNYTTKKQQKNTNTTNKDKKIGRTVLVCLFWLITWQIAASIVAMPLLLPDIWETVKALLNLFRDGNFYMDVLWTVFRCILAIFISVSIGTIIAAFSYKNKTIRALMTLPVAFFKAVPVMAVVIYLILLLKANWVAVAACFLMCFPIVYTNVLTGLDSVSEEFKELARVYQLNSVEVVKFIYFPGISSQINSAMKIVAGLSWKAVVAAEVLSVPKFSLGQGMISSKYYLETPTLFAYIIVIVTLSLLLEKLICDGTKRLTMRNYKGSKVIKKNNGSAVICNLPAPTIKLQKISKAFDEKTVLKEVNAEFNAGSKTAIIGISGSGKTTLARILTGLESYDEGFVDFSEEVKLSYLFQEDRLLPWLNIYDNLALGLLRDGVSLEENDDAIVKMAKSLEIEDVLWAMPDELSGGMKHRVSLGRTFLADSNVMVMDEPFRGLDEELKKRIVDRLWNSVSKDKTVVVITHNQSDIEMLGIDMSIFVG